MKKINHFTIDDIMRRRTLNSFNKQADMNSKNQKRKSNQQDDEHEFNQNQLLMNIFQEFKINKKGYSPVFSNEVKMHLVQIIGKKLNLKLNATKILPKMKIKKFYYIEIIDKPHTNLTMKRLQSSNQLLQSKKLDVSYHSLNGPKKYSYFVLAGNLHIYEKDHREESRKRSHDEQMSDQMMFYNWKQFELEYPLFKRTKTFSQFTGHGPVFMSKSQSEMQNSQQEKQFVMSRQNTNSHRSSQMMIAEEALIVEVENPEYDEDYINHAGMEYEKMAETIESFPIFNALGRKIRNFVQFFQLKEYQRNQQVYSIGDPVDRFYLLLKGQIVFQHNNTNPIKTPIGSPKQSRKNSIHMQMTIKTETVSSGNYFGQEEMIFSVEERLLTAKCKSSKCEVLEVSKEKFEKMLEYSDFHDCVKKAAEVKFRERLSKLEKNKQIRTKFALTEFNEEKDEQNFTSYRPQDLKSVPIFATPKRSLDGRFKVMHGNVIRQFSKEKKQKMTEDVQFSMLKVNPDMYDKTVDKFRKYNIKPKEKYVPEVNWELKRVWKVLNLENVLRQEAEVSSPEGRKFYDSHKRYICHIKESKSLRPKTSSSTYRTKLQYIAYLQKIKSQVK